MNTITRKDSASRAPIRRRRFTPAQRQRVLTRWRKSSLSQREFAVREGIGLSTFQNWLRHPKAGRKPSLAFPFQELLLPTGAAPWSLEIISPTRWTLRLASRPPTELLQELLHVLP